MIQLKSPREVAKMRDSGRIVAEILVALQEEVRPGITPLDLDRLAEEMTLKAKAIPSFKGYHGFPASVCISSNEQVVHGIPSDEPLQDGDIVSLDFGVIYNGYHGDSAVTVPVGNVSAADLRLIETTRVSLEQGIEAARPGAHLGDVGWAIQRYAESYGYELVREYTGHGIGRALHEEPAVPNFGRPGMGFKIKKGLVIAIEPMLNVGTRDVETLEDGWTVVTRDRKRSAHFEHTIAVTAEGPVVLTRV
jgi:methionyl aminopeptidase